MLPGYNHRAIALFFTKRRILFLFRIQSWALFTDYGMVE
jgi:hypothetical protein